VEAPGQLLSLPPPLKSNCPIRVQTSDFRFYVGDCTFLLSIFFFCQQKMQVKPIADNLHANTRLGCDEEFHHKVTTASNYSQVLLARLSHAISDYLMPCAAAT